MEFSRVRPDRDIASGWLGKRCDISLSRDFYVYTRTLDD